MKKIKLSTAKLQLNREKITELSNLEAIRGGDAAGGGGDADPMFLSIISCHSDNGGSRCSGCASCNLCCPDTVCPRTF